MAKNNNARVIKNNLWRRRIGFHIFDNNSLIFEGSKGIKNHKFMCSIGFSSFDCVWRFKWTFECVENGKSQPTDSHQTGIVSINESEALLQSNYNLIDHTCRGVILMFTVQRSTRCYHSKRIRFTRILIRDLWLIVKKAAEFYVRYFWWFCTKMH